MKLQIKPITKDINLIDISIDISPELGKATAYVRLENFILPELVVIEGAEYEAWGTDDNYIYDLILSKLGLEKA